MTTFDIENRMSSNPLLSIIVPCYNEEEILENCLLMLTSYIKKITNNYEVIVVDDGSTDKTFVLLKDLILRNKKIKGIKFTRNFGKESAMLAGLKASKGSAVIIMDVDLQHPPELLKTMFKYWHEDKYEVVEAVKANNKGRKTISNFTSLVFNFLFSKLAGFNMYGASDYKLIDRKVVENLIAMPEKNRFFRGLVNWTGYNTKQVFFDVPKRIGGVTKWSPLSLFRLSISAITSFSSIVLQIITALGLFTLLFSFVLAIQTMYNKIFGNAISGFTTVIILSLLLNSLIMISLGIIGIYLANIYIETKNRPFYIISDEISEKEEQE